MILTTSELKDLIVAVRLRAEACEEQASYCDDVKSRAREKRQADRWRRLEAKLVVVTEIKRARLKRARERAKAAARGNP